METTLYPGIPFSPPAALADNVGAGDTVIPVSDVEAFPAAPNLATIGTDEGAETVFYAAKTVAALSGCVRGVEGTARAWSAGEPIARNWTAKDHNDLIAAVGAAASGAAAAQEALEAHQEAGDAHSALFAAKQNKLTGQPGQVVGFGADGAAEAQDAPDLEDAVTVSGGAAVEMDQALGLGPYTIEIDPDDESAVSAAQVAYDGTQSKIGADTVQGAIDALAIGMRRVSNPNLLDNSRWENKSGIVNQRGQEEYTQAGYTIDRWYTPNSCGFSLTDHGISSTVNSSGTGAGNVLGSCYENCEYLRGKTVTASILIHHTDSAVCKPLIQIVGGSQNGQGFSPPLETQISEGVYSFTTTLPDDMTGLWFWIYFGDMRHDSGGEISTVKAAKLELGSVQTLARKEGDAWVLSDPPPDPALELLKCQRYQVPAKASGWGRFSSIACDTSWIFFAVPVPVTMRATPSIVNPDNFRVFSNNNAEQNGFTFSIDGYGPGWVGVLATKSNHGMTSAQLAVPAELSSPLFDANL